MVINFGKIQAFHYEFHHPLENYKNGGNMVSHHKERERKKYVCVCVYINIMEGEEEEKKKTWK